MDFEDYLARQKQTKKSEDSLAKSLSAPFKRNIDEKWMNDDIIYHYCLMLMVIQASPLKI